MALQSSRSVVCACLNSNWNEVIFEVKVICQHSRSQEENVAKEVGATSSEGHSSCAI